MDRRLARTLACGLVVAACVIVAPTASAMQLMTQSDNQFITSDNTMRDVSFAHAGTMGAGMVRTWVAKTSSTLNSPSDPSWSPLDLFVLKAVSNGTVPYLTIGYRPVFSGGSATSEIIPQPSPGNATAENAYVSAYADFCSAVATRYNGVVSYYSVWNEPNTASFQYPVGTSSGTLDSIPPQLYGKMYRACYSAINAVNSADKVFFGELATPGCTYANDAIDGQTTRADGLAIHPYQFDDKPTVAVGTTRCAGIGRLADWGSNTSNGSTGTNAVTPNPAFKTPDGGTVPLAVTEFGYWQPGGVKWHAGDPDDAAGNGPDTRYTWISSAYDVAKGAGAVIFSYYHLINEPAGTSWDSGIVDGLGVDSPSVFALRAKSGVQNPTVSAGTPSNVASTSATINGTVNPLGGRSYYHVDYGLTSAYGSTTSTVSAGSGTSGVSVAVPVSGLRTGTTYHYRIVVTGQFGAAQTADQTVTTSKETPAPREEIINGTPTIVVQGPGHTLDEYTYTSSAWHKATIAGAGTTYSNPDIQMIGTMPEVLVRGPENSLEAYWYTTAGWQHGQIAGPGTTFSDPVVHLINGVTQTAVQGPNHSLVLYWVQGSSWVHQELAPANSTYSSPQVVLVNGYQQIVVQGPSHSLEQYFADTSWHHWTIAGTDTTYSDPIMRYVQGHQMVVVQGPNHSLEQYWSDTAWHHYQVAGVNTTYSNPDVSDVSGAQQIVVRGASNEIVQYYCDTSWHTFTGIAGAGSSYADMLVQNPNGVPTVLTANAAGALVKYEVGWPNWTGSTIATGAF